MQPAQSLDSFDRRILAILQVDSACSIGSIAEQISLSANACWRRIRMMEERGIITRRVALLDAEKLGVGVTVFVNLRLSEHSPETLDRFARLIADMPEATEFCRISGEFDYLLKLQVADITAYDRAYKRLIQTVRLADVRASFAMEVLKRTTAISLEAIT
jgi:Lrp/AsnC family transcriptional regulator